MTTENSTEMFKHVDTRTLDAKSAKAFAKKAGARVGPGDELRLYVDKNGRPAQALLVRRESSCAVSYNKGSDFLWGLLIEIGSRALLVGDGDPNVVIDLQDLTFKCERVS